MEAEHEIRRAAVCPAPAFFPGAGAKAVEYGKKALELAGQEKPWLYMDTLATAYAEAGDFRKAVDFLKKALGLMTKPEDQKDRPDMEARLKLFQQGKPFREKPGPDRRP